MKVYRTDEIRNVVLLGHGGSGKTSLAEAMAYVSGAVNRMGKVGDGNTISDFDKEEQKRGFSIGTSLIPIEWEKAKINVLDTPGYFDFVGEVEEAVSVADAAVIVVSGKAGVEVAHLGDTLFIANIGKAGSSLLLFSIKKGERLGTLQSWQHDGGEKSFGSQIEAIVPSGNRLYVAERQSRIHVFRLPELSYLTCIGNGQWSGPVFQAQAMTVKDGLIFARDKNGMVSIYKEEDATPENYQKVNRYRRASGNGSPGNNGFASHSMQPDAEGHLLLTDYEGKKIRVLDPALVNDDMANDASIDLDDLSRVL